MSKVCNKVGVLKRAVETQFGKISWHVQIPIHISKMVLSTVNLGPPVWIRCGVNDLRSTRAQPRLILPTEKFAVRYASLSTE